MSRGRKRKKHSGQIGYNLRSGRFFDLLTGRFTKEKDALKFPGAGALREEQESFLEDLFESASEYFDSIEELRKFAPFKKYKKKEAVKKPLDISKRAFFKKDFETQENLLQEEDYDEYYGPQEYDLNVEKEIKKLKKKFSKQTKYRYLYNRSSDLRRKSKVIIAWLIVDATQRGTFMMRLRLGSKENMSVDEWSRYWTHERVGRWLKKKRKLPALIDMLRHNLLPSIGDQPSEKYKRDALNLVEVVGWHF